MILRAKYAIKGVVQGVGFRPNAFRIASKLSISGSIRNTAGTVELTIEGSESDIKSYIAVLTSNLTSGSRIDSITEISKLPITDSEKMMAFTIEPSEGDDTVEAVLPPDTAICPDCLKDIRDPSNRRYRHPFATCTACGPRYTVTTKVPFDRSNTTMAVFDMCPDCRKEYTDPADRRFHAQTTACPNCGPQLRLLDSSRNQIEGDPIVQAQSLLKQGRIIAIKGIGGFLLAADPLNAETIMQLRKRKHRPSKPFALMARNLGIIRDLAVVSRLEERLLESPEAPIVILQRNLAADSALSQEMLSPDTDTIGFMLPYSPLHELLMDGIDLLIMTSGNRHGEPICITDEEAFERLSGIADFYLVHDRQINYRNDDSLCIMMSEKTQVWRNARGYTPQAIRTGRKPEKCVLALGAEIKNTVSLSLEDSIIVSPHIGDMETPEAIESFEKITGTFPRFYNRIPEIIAVDLHPDMHPSVIGKRLADKAGIPLTGVQHHHAHGAALMLEHSVDSMLALVFDGTGLGTDGHIWGAELLHINREGFKRLATFKPALLPGGDFAVTEPWRQLIGRLQQYGIDANGYPGLTGIDRSDIAAVLEQSRKGINTPLSHAAGRLFDAVSCALEASGRKITYEGQAAIRLETLAMTSRTESLPSIKPVLCEVNSKNATILEADWKPFFEQLPELCARLGKADIAMIFHRAVADCAIRMIEYGLAKTDEKNIGISGGVFMNRLLNRFIQDDAERKGLRILTHSVLPPNDGCISAGQAAIVSGIFG